MLLLDRRSSPKSVFWSNHRPEHLEPTSDLRRNRNLYKLRRRLVVVDKSGFSGPVVKCASHLQRRKCWRKSSFTSRELRQLVRFLQRTHSLSHSSHLWICHWNLSSTRRRNSPAKIWAGSCLDLNSQKHGDHEHNLRRGRVDANRPLEEQRFKVDQCKRSCQRRPSGLPSLGVEPTQRISNPKLRLCNQQRRTSQLLGCPVWFSLLLSVQTIRQQGFQFERSVCWIAKRWQKVFVHSGSRGERGLQLSGVQGSIQHRLQFGLESLGDRFDGWWKIGPRNFLLERKISHRCSWMVNERRKWKNVQQTEIDKSNYLEIESFLFIKQNFEVHLTEELKNLFCLIMGKRGKFFNSL